MSISRDPIWEPSDQDYWKLFDEQNPWQSTRGVPESLGHRAERSLAKYLWKRLLDDSPHRFQVVLGPRRVGKTTCMYQTVRALLNAGVEPDRLWWLRVDHPLYLTKSLGELVASIVANMGASETRPVFVFLDELTYAKDWDLWLKTFYDDAWPIRIVGSSSATAILRDRRMESGVGRWEEQTLSPYLFSEYLALVGENRIIPVEATLSETIQACLSSKIRYGDLAGHRRKFMLAGGFPELLLDVGRIEQTDDETLLLRSQQTLRSDAVERAIYKDIPQAFNIDNPMLLERLLYTLAGQVSGVLSPTNICRCLDGMSQPTFDRYLSYLTQAFLVFVLPNYSGSEDARQRRGRKLYFVDGSIRNAALQRGIAPLNDTMEMGLLMENLVAAHMHALAQQSQVRLYHWREGDHEVDLIYDHPSAPLAFEVKHAFGHDVPALHRFVEKFPRFRGACYVVAPNAPAALSRTASDGIGAIPLDLLLLAVGAQAEAHLRQRLSVV